MAGRFFNPHSGISYMFVFVYVCVCVCWVGGPGSKSWSRPPTVWQAMSGRISKWWLLRSCCVRGAAAMVCSRCVFVLFYFVCRAFDCQCVVLVCFSCALTGIYFMSCASLCSFVSKASLFPLLFESMGTLCGPNKVNTQQNSILLFKKKLTENVQLGCNFYCQYWDN